MKAALALISALMLIVAAPPYIVDTLHQKTRPERATWLVFSVLNLIAFISLLLLDASWSLLFSGVDTVASLLILGLSIKYGVGGYGKRDISALIIAAIGVVCAVTTKQAVVSLAGVIVADLTGVALTAVKAYRQPSSETAVSWLLSGTAALCSALAVGRLSFRLLAYPLFYAISSYAIPLAQLAGAWHGRRQIGDNRNG